MGRIRLGRTKGVPSTSPVGRLRHREDRRRPDAGGSGREVHAVPAGTARREEREPVAPWVEPSGSNQVGRTKWVEPSRSNQGVPSAFARASAGRMPDGAVGKSTPYLPVRRGEKRESLLHPLGRTQVGRAKWSDQVVGPGCPFRVRHRECRPDGRTERSGSPRRTCRHGAERRERACRPRGRGKLHVISAETTRMKRERLSWDPERSRRPRSSLAARRAGVRQVRPDQSPGPAPASSCRNECGGNSQPRISPGRARRPANPP